MNKTDQSVIDKIISIIKLPETINITIKSYLNGTDFVLQLGGEMYLPDYFTGDEFIFLKVPDDVNDFLKPIPIAFFEEADKREFKVYV